jgi:2-(1,2-epoxy-1,2-dihydrophenyl)acetyl-CoA isomerase
MGEILLSETSGAVRVLTLNRPERLNPLDNDMLAALNAAFDEIARTPGVRAVLLTGAGRGFCAGADLGQSLAGGSAPDLAGPVDQLYNPLVRKMRALPQPIVAAVNGVAAGAGMNLALAADIIIAARAASFSQAFIRIGLIPDAGGTFFLPRLIGEARARAMAMLGETITAEQAVSYGLIWRAYEDDVFSAEALKLAHTLATKPSKALAAMKQLYAASAANSLDAQLDLERDFQGAMGTTAEFAEGVAAFLQKRPAVFN